MWYIHLVGRVEKKRQRMMTPCVSRAELLLIICEEFMYLDDWQYFGRSMDTTMFSARIYLIISIRHHTHYPEQGNEQLFGDKLSSYPSLL